MYQPTLKRRVQWLASMDTSPICVAYLSYRIGAFQDDGACFGQPALETPYLRLWCVL